MTIGGRLTAVAIPENSHTVIYVGDSDKITTANLNICNTSSDAIMVRAALLGVNPSAVVGQQADPIPINGEYIEFGATIPVGGVLERPGIVIGPYEVVVVWASGAGISAVMWGFKGGVI